MSADDLDLPPDVDWTHGLAMLDSFIADAISTHPRPIRKKLRALIDNGCYLVSTRFTIGADGKPMPFSLTYVVHLPVTPDDVGDWATLLSVHWTRLELSPDHVYRELAVTLLQHAAGDPLIEVTTNPAAPSPRRDPPPETGAA